MTRSVLSLRFAVFAVLATAGVMQAQLTNYWVPRGAPLTDGGVMKTIEMVEPRKEITSIPITITTPGSYYLIASMTGSPSMHGITIRADDVRLDLCGFSLVGTSNSFSGIHVATQANNVVLENGVLRNWGWYGVNGTNMFDGTLTDIKAYGNGTAGILAGENCLVERCSAFSNGYDIDLWPGKYDDGIVAYESSTIIDCKARFNNGSGFNVFRAVKLTGCTASENGFIGVYGWNYCTIRDCLVTRNYSDGIAVWDNCRVEGNNCGENGTVWSGSTNYGFGAGIAVFGSASRIENNNVADNDYGIWVHGVGATANLIIHNSAVGNVYADYMTSVSGGGDYFGQVLDTTDLNSGSNGFSAGTPWSNFEF